MNKGRRQNSLLKGPIKILSKARDFYIRSFSDCAGQFDFIAGMGCPTAHVSTLPRSFSGNTNTSTRSNREEDDHFSELVRITSARGLNKKVETEFHRRQKSLPATGGSNNRVMKVMGRSQSLLGIERIDEDKECEFGDDDVQVKADEITFRKSQSGSHYPLSATKFR